MMKSNHGLRCAALLGAGLMILLLWGMLSLLLNLQPTDNEPSHLVLGAVGKFLLFPIAISLFAYVFWALLLQAKQVAIPKPRICKSLIVGGLILPVMYILSLPCLFFWTPLQGFFAEIFPVLDRLLYAPPGICVIVADMLPLAIAFEGKKP